VRYFLLSGHYRQPLNLLYNAETGAFESFTAAKAALDRIDECRARLAEAQANAKAGESVHPELQESLDHTDEGFKNALANDLDISGALGSFFSLIKEANRLMNRSELSSADARAVDLRLKEWDRVLGIVNPETKPDVDASRIEALIAERNAARRAKNFTRADEIRDQLAAEGIILQDTPEGTRWRRK
jgi:cysteinyl-tRNA synthetase